MMDVSLVDVGIEWFKDIIEAVTRWFQQGLGDGYSALTNELFGTPTPETDGPFVFGSPTNEPWVGIHDALVAGEITALSLLLLVVCVQARHTISIFNLGTTYEARRTKKVAWAGAFLIFAWYWIAAVSLYVVDALTIALIPELGVLLNAMVDFFATPIPNPVLGLLMAGIGGFAMWVLQALLFIRDVLLFVFIYGMPIGFALVYGNLPVLSRIAKSVCMRFVPLLIMPVPIALIFSGYELVFHEGTSATLAPGVIFLQHFVAVSLPVLSVIVVWKLFQYASPLATSAAGTAARATFKVGAILGAGYLAGPKVAGTAARWGPKVAAGQAFAQRVGNTSNGESPKSESAKPAGGTKQDSVATDAYGQQGVATYRRTENDPGYY
ncbi:hypothetical protein SAMN05216559_1815 [Halomicrobium zhouii]|uniref:Type IV secretion system protein TrbL n=1 Tax=Halomicrobium zhouii TaxID=767519 RepID=A0A1I6L1A8_9EURY|nr:hypothetical protein [Halomicrobium zhouii]SFR97237.1 hypothetical protein SAMN05216559_1815 [Halomicrobium zhouii]